MMCRPLPHHCSVDRGITSTKRLRNPIFSRRRAGQAGTGEGQTATNSRIPKTTAISPPHGIRVSPAAAKELEPVQGIPFVLRSSVVAGGRRIDLRSSV
jgi:hypothetical protein